MMPCISLLSDFGCEDSYLYQMRAQLSQALGKTQLIDISHKIPPGQVLSGAFLLWECAPWVPKDSMVLAVVDPTVGSARRGLVIKAGNIYFVGPDNGLMVPAAHRLGIESVFEIQEGVVTTEVSSTFHGRDIFVPVVIKLCSREPKENFLRETHDYHPLDLFEEEGKKGSVQGKVLHIDHFGNVITNLFAKNFQFSSVLWVKGHAFSPLRDHYAQVEKGEPILLTGSQGLLELSLNQGNFAKAYEIKVGDLVECKTEV